MKTKELSLKQVVLSYSVPKSTLADNVTGKSTTRYGGIPKALSATEEAKIVVTCQVSAEKGFPMNQDYVNAAVHSYLAQEGKHIIHLENQLYLVETGGPVFQA